MRHIRGDGTVFLGLFIHPIFASGLCQNRATIGSIYQPATAPRNAFTIRSATFFAA